MTNTKFLQTKNIYFRPYDPADIPVLTRWLNDPEVTHFMFYGQLPKTVEEVKAFIEGDVSREDCVIFIICNMDDVPIGFCGLYDWHRTSRRAEMRILIGDKEQWGRGTGTESVELITWYGFDRLGLHRIYLGVTAENKAAIKVYEKAGYDVEGHLRDDIYRNGRFYDSVRMAILQEKYQENLREDYKKRFGPNPPRYLKEGGS